MKNQDLKPELISIAEAALKLSVSERTIARLIADGQLHALKLDDAPYFHGVYPWAFEG
jgi:hypothetical protein